MFYWLITLLILLDRMARHNRHGDSAKITHLQRDCEILSTAISCHLANALYSRTIANCVRGLRMNINDMEITVMLTIASNIAYASGLRAACRSDIARWSNLRVIRRKTVWFSYLSISRRANVGKHADAGWSSSQHVVWSNYWRIKTVYASWPSETFNVLTMYIAAYIMCYL